MALRESYRRRFRFVWKANSRISAWRHGLFGVATGLYVLLTLPSRSDPESFFWTIESTISSTSGAAIPYVSRNCEDASVVNGRADPAGRPAAVAVLPVISAESAPNLAAR